MGAHATTPCVACHLGDATATTEAGAHQGLETEPGALDTAARTCGACHPAQLASVLTLPMTTGRGIVGVDRYVFGENPTPDTEQTLAQVLATPTPSPAEDHLRKLCAGCHLGTRRADRDDAIRAGGSGCSACHASPRRAEALALAGWPGALPITGNHPTVDARVPDTRCLGCHSRSSRIALSYAGYAELSPGETCATPATLPDGRPACRTTPDVHATAGLACIDCHPRVDLMGDGVSRAHQEQAVTARCEGCHVPTKMQALSNVHAEGDGWRLVGKLDGVGHGIPAVATDHTRDHAQLRCATCHAASAPTCPVCHTRHDVSGDQWDFAAGAPTPGRWVETGGGFTAAAPALGVTAEGEIVPAIPGMIATIEGIGEVRRFSLLDPHTTTRAGRSCVDCHRSPTALGLGTGTLDVETFRFTPTRPTRDNPFLAEDGWVTLGTDTPGQGTRLGARSLNATEQRTILRVGVCLACHPTAADPIWVDYAGSRARRREPGHTCTARPGWWDAD